MASTISSASPASASDEPARKPAASKACASAEHRQFDFWLGRWAVADPEGKPLGTNLIARSDTGCWITEQWHSAGNFSGTSLNAWDAQHKRWRQFWVGSDGLVLRLEGGLRDGAMVMEGLLPTSEGKTQRQRISWTPNDDGSVSQRWETSDDDGRSWTTAFLGIYRREGGNGKTP